MYKHVLNSVVKISMMFANYFQYYAIILRGPFFVDMLYFVNLFRLIADVRKKTALWKYFAKYCRVSRTFK